MKSLYALLAVALLTTPTFADEDMNSAQQEEAAASPTEIRRGMVMAREIDGKPREQVYYERIIERVEPSLIGDPEKLNVYIRLFERELIMDKNTFPTEVKAEKTESGAVKLSGFVGYSENRESLEKLFHYLGFENIENEVEVLPSKDLGSQVFGIVSVPRVFIYSKATEPRERMNEFLFGDPVFILKDTDNGYSLIMGSDGYVGYLESASLHRTEAKSFNSYQNAPKASLKSNISVGEQTIYAGSTIPVASVDDTAGTAKLKAPNGVTIDVSLADVNLLPEGSDPRALTAIEVAKSKLDSNYVWGGKTVDGIDCSGLVQSAYLTMGINLPRDTYMQAYVGRLVATRWHPEGMQPGDLMFFVANNGRINHTAIYIGDKMFVEASGRVKLTSMDPESEFYDARRTAGFVFAKRLFN